MLRLFLAAERDQILPHADDEGKSLPFLVLILLGYVAGITSKLLNPNGFKWYVMFFYVLNFCFVSIDFSLYFRNLCLDRQAAEKKLRQAES